MQVRAFRLHSLVMERELSYCKCNVLAVLVHYTGVNVLFQNKVMVIGMFDYRFTVPTHITIKHSQHQYIVVPTARPQRVVLSKLYDCRYHTGLLRNMASYVCLKYANLPK